LLPRPEGLHVLFTERSKELRSHAGQISFPGGSMDIGDPDARATALREAQEEVGLRQEHVEVVGAMDDCPTFVTGFVITPVVGVVDPLAFTAAGRYPWTPSPAERAALPDLPKAHLVVEAVARNTAPAIGLACVHALREDREATLMVLSSDHQVARPDPFRDALALAASACQGGDLLTLGIKPTRAE